MRCKGWEKDSKRNDEINVRHNAIKILFMSQRYHRLDKLKLKIMLKYWIIQNKKTRFSIIGTYIEIIGTEPVLFGINVEQIRTNTK